MAQLIVKIRNVVNPLYVRGLSSAIRFPVLLIYFSGRFIDRQTDRQRGRQTDRKIDRLRGVFFFILLYYILLPFCFSFYSYAKIIQYSYVISFQKSLDNYIKGSLYIRKNYNPFLYLLCVSIHLLLVKSFVRISNNSGVGMINLHQEGRGHWAVYYISPQSFIITFLYSLV